ncbi:MAG: translation elongation factor Ts [Alphaproteobacteria bacterium]|jgi:elongation factor Ts|uniref:Translation elongation factor EFTs/EF1B dimerisation domain-containing protein n=1 Tax=marine metagenome TaxID=408172 RepID=A0A381YZ44_9ZZZZ|nr:translation elongation factor Ts [Alphaproteobacteria bacterium]
MNNIMVNVKNLRDMTGAGFLDCKKALEANDQSIEKSIVYLRKKGLAKANKKSSRQTNEGAIGLYSNEAKTVLIQINTETDFAAKNEVFLNFMNEIGGFALEVDNINISLESFVKLSFRNKIISEYFTDIITKIGENIILSQLIIVPNNDGCMISTYIHNAYKKNIGKIAVVLKSKINEIDEESKILGKNLCMHIAASKPFALSIEKLNKNLIKKEREIQIETIKSSGKPNNILEKILEGKMKKFYSDSVLLEQPYILDLDKTVKQIITEFSKRNNFEIIDYKLIVLNS